MKKISIVGILSAAILAICFAVFWVEKEAEQEVSTGKSSETSTETSANITNTPSIQTPAQVEELNNVNTAENTLPKITKKVNLYQGLSNNQLPLSAIAELAILPEDIQENVNELIESQKNIYLLKKNGDKILLIIENPSDSRHNIDLAEISLASENIKNIPFGSHIAGDETERDIWEYEDDDDTKRPVKHIKHDLNNDIEYTEYWNYEENNPIKYEMRDNEDKIVSIKKQIIDNETSLREEHILYNSNGSIKTSVSISYTGPNITRFTYYNSEHPEENMTLQNEFSEEGNKVKETLYTSDFKPIREYKASYREGIRTELNVFDSKGLELEKFLAK